MRRSPISLILVLLAVTTTATGQRCGVERWSVKTGTDADATQVDLGHPQSSDIASLVQLSPPRPVPAIRVGPTETTVFVVNATLTDYKLEGGSHGDSDYHLVLSDNQGHTMVAEIPSPACVDPSSPFASLVANARAQFDARLTATSSFQTANIPVQVTGVGFFDFAHGQRGAAPNVIELHPVLDIVFNPQPGGDFTVAIAPSALNLIQGGTASANVTVTTSGGASVAPSFTASGAPTGVTVSIAPLGNGKASLTFNATQAATTGSFPVTVSATVSGKSHSQIIPLNISPFSPSPGTQQWEYQVISASSEQEVVDKANQLGAEEWEMVSAVRVSATSWRAFFKRLKRNF